MIETTKTIYQGPADRCAFPRTVQAPRYCTEVTPGGNRKYRSCMELGLCQTRNPACSGCSWKFGKTTFDSRRQRRHARLLRWVSAAFGVFALVALVAFLAGYVLRSWGGI